MVLLHGYGAGLGFFFKNYGTLADWAGRKGTNVYAVDWLGMGRSARVPFNVTAKRTDVVARVSEAESFFIDSLEEWREKMGLEEMTIVGHSLGAYLSAAYALKYPDRVNKLILLSPAGVPRGPNHTEPSRELTDEGSNPNGLHPSSPSDRSTQGKAEALRAEQKQTKQQESRSRRLLTYLWEEGWSPFQVVRSSLFLGPMLVGKYSSRRFPSLDQEETKDVHDYLLNITLAKGSGEYCISHILAPGAHARLPLVDRVHALRMPVTWVYGEHDWMDPLGGMQAVQVMEQNGNRKVKMAVIPDAGHHCELLFFIVSLASLTHVRV